MKTKKSPLGKSRKKWLWALAAVLFPLAVLWWFCLPDPLFNNRFATVLFSAEGQLLSAQIAPDQQWRLPPSDSLPGRFATALILYEDAYFYWHPGVNPVAIARALWQNIRAGRTVSGGSTLSMQTIRLMRKGQARTITEKAIEIFMATRLEFGYSKHKILRHYATHAPFGGNTVGLDAASFRYFGRRPSELSWAEAALLAVLPNQPSLIFPGKNQLLLLKKRDRLLHKLFRSGHIDQLTLELALEEPIPQSPLPFPRQAEHLLTKALQEGRQGSRLASTLQSDLQAQTQAVMDRYHRQFRANRVHNAAAVVIEVTSGNALAYVGNVGDKPEHGHQVDIIGSPRGTGSILKPFLYAAMLDEGLLLPDELLPDVPTFFSSFAPKNYDGSFSGAVPASTALARSLNVPAVRMLADYRVEKFHAFLQQIGLNSLRYGPEHYGLSLILGGAEASLWNLCGIYASMARVLAQYPQQAQHHYNPHHWHGARWESVDIAEPDMWVSHYKVSAPAIWHTFEAMLELERPGQEAAWRLFDQSRKIAWKTGTSHGNRDAWAIGLTPTHVVGVWVGNADGEGRPGTTGFATAAPLMFELFNLLPRGPWFNPPYDELSDFEICAESGMLPGPACNLTQTVAMGLSAANGKTCPFHQRVNLDPSGKFRVHSDCQPAFSIRQENYFVLPPAMEFYYRQRTARYKTLPPWREDCYSGGQLTSQSIQVISPAAFSTVGIPIELSGNRGKLVVEVAHRRPNSTIFWHLNGQYLGSTQQMHQMELSPNPGSQWLTLTDEQGETLVHTFQVMRSE